MNIGFTGTRRGLTKYQRDKLSSLADKFDSGKFFYGDCIGADAEAAVIFYQRNWKLCCCPPENKKARAFMPNKLFHYQVSPPKPYLERNHDIVDRCDILIATPAERTERLRSGTWATIRYARKKNKQIIIIYP